MPTISRPDGTTINYEVHGSGFPLLLIAPGGVSSEIAFWRRGPIDPIRDFASDFTVIAMDQRFAGKSHAPAKAFSYEDASADQLAVLDAVGVPQAHVMGGCIGNAHIWALLQAANGRITSAVCQNPVGLDATNNIGTFYKMFDDTMRLARSGGMDAVIQAAIDGPVFAMANGGGPFSQRLHDDPAFREELRKLTVESYVALIVRFRDGLWPDNTPFFTASEAWMRECPVPLIVLPGSDAFHPTGVANRIAELAPNAVELDVDCRGPEKLEATIETVRAFLKANTPA